MLEREREAGGVDAAALERNTRATGQRVSDHLRMHQGQWRLRRDEEDAVPDAGALGKAAGTERCTVIVEHADVVELERAVVQKPRARDRGCSRRRGRGR